MLTKRENALETIKGGKPDRFVNQYEYLNIVFPACVTMGSMPMGPGNSGKDFWGVSWNWPEGQIGPFPLHDDEHKVIKDVTEWRKYVKRPAVPDDNKIWTPGIEYAKQIDRNEEFAAVWVVPGLFEMTHNLMGMEDALMGLYEEPEAMVELIDCITDFELEYASVLLDKIKPDALFHHDDWGSQINSFISPDMFEEFYLPPYKKIYKFFKDNGIEVIVHHSDSYAANLVPFMIDMGIDVWQGVMNTNDIPSLTKEYGEKLTFMGGLHNGEIDNADWKPEICARHVETACTTNGKDFFMPCLTQGGPASTFPGVYDEVSRQIDIMSEKMF